jgi:TLD
MVVPPYDNLKLTEPSVMEEVNLSLPLFYSWLMKKDKMQFDLVYRGSRDGFTVNELNEKLKGKGPLIFIVKSAEHKMVFGGYTSIPWSAPKELDSQFHYDHNAFIFSVTKKSKHLPF